MTSSSRSSATSTAGYLQENTIFKMVDGANNVVDGDRAECEHEGAGAKRGERRRLTAKVTPLADFAGGKWEKNEKYRYVQTLDRYHAVLIRGFALVEHCVALLLGAYFSEVHLGCRGEFFFS